MRGGGSQFELRYGLSKTVFSKERVKPYFLLLLINIIIKETLFLKISLNLLKSFRRSEDFFRQYKNYFHRFFGIFDVSLLQTN